MRYGLTRTISINGGLGLLQMVLELVIGECADENASS